MNLKKLTDAVMSLISFCEDMCVQTKTFSTYNSNKASFNTELWKVHQAKEEAYRSWDCVLYKRVRNTLTREIRAFSKSYCEKLMTIKFSTSDPASVWRGLQDMIN